MGTSSIKPNTVITKNSSSQKNIPGGTIQLKEVLGLPPSPLISESVMMNSFPIINIEPCEAKWGDGLSLFILQNQWVKYKSLLENLGYTPGTDRRLRIAFIPDQLPSEQFTNEYGQTFLSQITDMVSNSMTDMAQMSGNRNASEFYNSSIKSLNAAGGVASSVASLLGGVAEQFKGVKTAMKGSKNPTIRKIPDVMNNMLMGQRVDFPQVWKHSSYVPTYSVNVKLINMFPKNIQLTKELIVGPLAAILGLALPIGESETYSYPFLHKVSCPGLFDLKAAGISSITVNKGGDHSLIGYNEILGAVDIRIDFVDLFSVMMMYDPNSSVQSKDRTNLKSYLDTMLSGRSINKIKSTLDDNSEEIKTADSTKKYTNIPGQAAVDTTTPASDRTSSEKRNIATDLESRMPKI